MPDHVDERWPRNIQNELLDGENRREGVLYSTGLEDIRQLPLIVIRWFVVRAESVVN